MSVDPRRFKQDEESLEKRFETIFSALSTPASPRPTDLASALVFLQELYDKLAPRGQ